MKKRFQFLPAGQLPALLLALALGLGSHAAWAQGRFGTGPAVTSRAAQILAGDSTSVTGRNFKPGSKVTLSADGAKLNAEPFVADDEGRFQGDVRIPKKAARGALSIVVMADGAEVSKTQLKISEKLPLAGVEQFEVAQEKLRPGLYQLAVGDDAAAIYVTRAAFGPERQTELMKVDPKTLGIMASTTPPATDTWGQPSKEGERTPPPVYAVYGIATDTVNDTVWVTNTVNNTAAVYRQGDLSLLRQFEPDVVPHARAAAVDGERGKAYVAAFGTGEVAVFDTKTLQHLKNIKIASTQDGKEFGAIGLTVDAASGTLYVASAKSPEVAVISTADDAVQNVWPLEQASGLRDVAWDATHKRLLAVDFGTDDLLVIDPTNGKVEHAVGVGASPLAVTWDPVSGHAFVANRGAGTVAVVDAAAGKLAANLAIGSYPNDIVADGKGVVYVVNKAQGQDDAKGDMITRIQPKAD